MSGSADVDALLLQVRKNAVLLQVICFFELLQFKTGLKYVQGVRFCKAANDANSYERIAPLSSTNQTNWLTQNAPNAMLFGTLLQAMPFLKNDQRTIFQSKYSEAIAALKGEDVSRVGDRQAIAVDS